MSKNQNNTRADRKHGHRARYDANRKRLLLSQPDFCAICGKPIDYSLKYPHPMSPSVDHIIPVTKGGHPFDMDNLQVAHLICNRMKSDKIAGSDVIHQTQDRLISNRDLPHTFDWLHPDAISTENEV